MQQIPFIDLLIDLFKSALHVSGDKLAHLQEHFLTVYTAFGTVRRYCWYVSGDKLAHPQEHFLIVYTAFGTMHRYCCRQATRLRWNSTEFHLNLFACRQQYRCIVPKAVYTAKKCSWGWASLSLETCTAHLKRSIRRSINGICCILLVSYIVIVRSVRFFFSKIVNIFIQEETMQI